MGSVLWRRVVLDVVLEATAFGKGLGADIADEFSVLGEGVHLFHVTVEEELGRVAVLALGTFEGVLVQVNAHMVKGTGSAEVFAIAAEDERTGIAVGVGVSHVGE